MRKLLQMFYLQIFTTAKSFSSSWLVHSTYYHKLFSAHLSMNHFYSELICNAARLIFDANNQDHLVVNT